MTKKETLEKFGVTEKQLEEWEADAAKGILPGKPAGEVVVGRPLKFGEETKQVGFKEPLSKIDAIERRAKQLGMRRSDYLRGLVDADLKAAGMV